MQFNKAIASKQRRLRRKAVKKTRHRMARHQDDTDGSTSLPVFLAKLQNGKHRENLPAGQNAMQAKRQGEENESAKSPLYLQRHLETAASAKHPTSQDRLAEKQNKQAAETGLKTASHPAIPALHKSPPRISRATKRRETRPITKARADIAKEVGKSYWGAKLGSRYKLNSYNPIGSRFKSNKEEREAVLQAVWRNMPAKKSSAATRLISIPARAGVKNSKNLLYQAQFKPAKGKKKARVVLTFLGEGGAAKVSATPTPATTYKPGSFAYDYSGFPKKNNITAYFKAHPEEQRQVFNWIENVAPASFDQVITTSVSKTKGNKTTTRKASYQVKRTKPSLTGSGGILINFLGARTPVVSGAPGAGYDQKSLVDFELERLQSKTKGKLGKLTGLAKLPKDEVSSVKYMIWQYFKFSKVRKSELDLIIPIANTKLNVHYTLRFDSKTNNVDIERIGEAGKGKVKPGQIDITRVQGYADNSKDVASLSSWLKKRYPSVTLTGKTLQAIRLSVNKSIKANAGKRDWFLKNYGIHILAAGDAKNRLKNQHKWPAARCAGVKEFTSGELVRLELTLQTMSLPVLAQLKKLRLIRQDAYLKKKGNHYKAYSKTFGYTLKNSGDISVLLFDSFTKHEHLMFSGGKLGVRSVAIERIAHELGHAAGYQQKIESKFKAFVKANSIKPVSWYAATGKSEHFAEAFAFYHADPEWMKKNIPKLYNWFETLRKTGKPPP